jgi:hypothetical protein
MARLEKRKPERVRYWPGQLLKSQDFRDIAAVEAQRRWWHNRALHNAFGVAAGLSCTLQPAASPTGLLVSPGIAYDVSGREVALEQQITVPFPPVSQDFTGTLRLLISYRPPRGRRDEDAEICFGAKAPDTPEFSWRTEEMVRPADGVPLAAVSLSGGKFKSAGLSLANAAQPIARPLMAAGATVPGNTPWEAWAAGLMFGESQRVLPAPIGVQTRIDTSAAGFTRIPCYFASVQGPVWDARLRQLAPAIFPSIAEESITGFTFRLWLQMPSFSILQVAGPDTAEFEVEEPGFRFVTDPADFVEFAQRQGLFVSWTGCQMLDPISSCCAEAAPDAALNPAARNS